VVQPEPEAGSLFDPYYLGVGGAGVAILGLLGWFWWRRRKVDEETNLESMFASSSMIEAPDADKSLSVPVVEDGAAVHDVGTVDESSFLSEFTPSDFDSFDTDQGEIDPISEADVYLAYGRYQQAEELIRQAIKDQPNRDECKLKLLEIFYANENKAAFEVYSNELAEAGKRNDFEFWEKAAEMGREICPDSPLFSSGEELFPVVDDTDVENNGGSNIADDEFSKESANAGAASFGKSAGEDFVKETTETKGSMPDFDLTSSEVGAEEDSFVDEQRNNQDIDFDLSSFSMGSDAEDQSVIASSAQLGKSSGAQAEDADLSSFSLESDVADQGVIAPSIQLGKSSGAQAEDTDLSSFSMESDVTDQGVVASNTQLGKSSEAKAEDADLSSFSFSMESDVTDQGVVASSTQLGKSSNAETKEIDSLDFRALENDLKNNQGIDFASEKSLDLNDELGSDFDFNFDLDMPSIANEKDADQHGEFGVSDLTDMDELETKLDLAKAYVDMGDAEAAKDLAREVLEQGTDKQKKIAQSLIDELDLN
jgi:pilus assembly protein FimV